ncbi:hypothetical protein FOZ61_009802, partial [Perkinsus olseni]
RVKELLKANEAKVKALSMELFNKETLVFTDLQDVLGPRPYGVNDKYLKYIDTKAGVEMDKKEAAEAAAEAAAAAKNLTEKSGVSGGDAVHPEETLDESSGIDQQEQQRQGDTTPDAKR